MVDIETGALIQNILSRNLKIPPERISNYNSDWDVPKDDGVYIIVKIESNPPYGRKNTYIQKNNSAGESSLFEIQSMSVLEDVTISVISKSVEARKMAPLVMLALGSTYSIQQQELYGLKISRPESRDASDLEATARLNRFDISVKIYRGYKNEMEVDYYDKFPLAKPIIQE